MKKQIYNPYLPEWEGERTFEIYVDGELMEDRFYSSCNLSGSNITWNIALPASMERNFCCDYSWQMRPAADNTARRLYFSNRDDILRIKRSIPISRKSERKVLVNTTTTISQK